MNKHNVRRTVLLLVVFPITLIAQLQRDAAPLTPWPAPLYWQPTQAENQIGAANLNMLDAKIDAATPANSLVFVGMTPCRIADTRDATFPAGFGPPSLTGQASRTFAIQSLSSRCPVPSIAQAYSFNITVVPPGAVVSSVNPSGALGFLTIWPSGGAQPLVSTLNNDPRTGGAKRDFSTACATGSINGIESNNQEPV